MHKKILFSILFLIVLIFSHTYTYYIADEKAQLKAFMAEVKMDTILLKALDDNKTDLAENILTWSSDGLFYAAGARGNVQRFLPICKHMNKYTIDLLEKNGLFEDSNSSDMELKEANRLINIGRERIEKLCGIK